MALRIIDKDFNFLGYLDSSSSIQFTRKHYEVGSIEIHVDKKANGAEYLKPAAIVYLDAARAAVIETYNDDEGKSDEIVATGKQIKNFCHWRRTAPGQIEDSQYYGYDRFPAINDPDLPTETVIKHYVDRHMVNPEDPLRVFPHLIIADDQLRGAAIRWQSRMEWLTDVFQSIGEQTGMGYDIYLDYTNKQYIFDVIQGNDHTVSSENPVVFSAKWGNVSKVKYSEDTSKYFNTAYCGGAGENEGRLIQVVYENDIPRSGFDRRETWYDCGSGDNLDDLIYEGKYKLKADGAVFGISGDIILAGPFQYRQGWDLGDMVTIQTRSHEMDARITEVKEVYERGKASIIPTFGARNKNALDEIRKREVVR